MDNTPKAGVRLVSGNLLQMKLGGFQRDFPIYDAKTGEIAMSKPLHQCYRLLLFLWLSTLSTLSAAPWFVNEKPRERASA